MSALFNRPIAAVPVGVAALIAAAAPAAAQDSNIVVRGMPEGTKMELVTFNDLNLRYIAHLNVLNSRVARAVRHVCDFEPRENLRGYEDCANAAWAGARPQMHRAYLRANRLALR